jgi:hypothetical protein
VYHMTIGLQQLKTESKAKRGFIIRHGCWQNLQQTVQIENKFTKCNTILPEIRSLKTSPLPQFLRNIFALLCVHVPATTKIPVPIKHG